MQTGEYLVRIAVEQTHESHPFLLVVLEAHHVALQFLRSHLHNVVQRFHRHIRSTLLLLVDLLLVLLRHGDHHSRTASVAIDGAALASRTPSLYVELVHECLVYVVRQVHGYADRVVHPLLYSALHAHLHQPVDIVSRSFIIR